MAQSLAHIALVVRDYDEAIAWFTDKLGFTLVADEYQPEQDKRWVLDRAARRSDEGAATILLARASTPEQEAFIGNQAGGRVFLFLATDDFDRDHAAMTAKGVEWARPPAIQPYGKVAVFLDLYGNKWDLIEFADARQGWPPARPAASSLRGRRPSRAPPPGASDHKWAFVAESSGCRMSASPPCSTR